MSKLYQTLDLRGQTVLITGASAGIGEACAWRFAEAGCALVLVARRLDRLESIKAKLEEEYKVPIFIKQIDLTDIQAVEALQSELPEEFAKVDILVNNAGFVVGVPTVAETVTQDLLNMLHTNVTSAILLTREFVKGMLQRNHGHIINLSSIAAKEAYGGGGVYCATKHALDAFSISTRHDLVGTPIRVTTISPGAVKTEFSIVRFQGDVQKADAVYEGLDPLTAADIADNVMYAATRPAHVQVCDMLVLATNQSSAKTLARVKLSS